MWFRFGVVWWCLALLLAAVPAQAQTEYRGGGFVSRFAGCGANGWSGREAVLARVSPAGLPGNDPANSRISLFLSTYALHFSLPAAGLDSGQWAAAVATGWIGARVGSGDLTPRPLLRRVALPSATVDPGGTLHLVADIANFDYLTGCTVRVNIVARLRP